MGRKGIPRADSAQVDLLQQIVDLDPRPDGGACEVQQQQAQAALNGGESIAPTLRHVWIVLAQGGSRNGDVPLSGASIRRRQYSQANPQPGSLRMIRALCLNLLLFSIASSTAIAAPFQGKDTGVEWGPWSVLLPFEHPGGGANVEKVHPPERELKSMRLGGDGPDFEREWVGKEKRKIRWQPARATEVEAPDTGKVDFLTLVPEDYPDKSNTLTAFSVAYAYRTLRSPRDQKVTFSFGSDDGARIWLNGKQVHDAPKLRGLNPLDDPLELELKAGLNHLFVKIPNEGGGWGCQLMGPAGPEKEAPETPIETINKAIEKGAVYLLKTQNLDGSWTYDGKTYRNGQTALSIYALLKSGLTEDHPAIRRGIEFLRANPPRKTYSAAMQILALVSTKSERHQSWIEEIAQELMDWQEGGFGYPSRENDLSNTQYGALGLWAAGTVGIEVPDRVWLYLARNAMNHQTKDGGFSYRMQGAANGSMTVAGLTILAICKQGFGDSGWPSQLEKKAEKSIDEGVQWLTDHFSSTENPKGPDRWRHYYLYGIERLAALLGVERIGHYDWYRQASHEYVKGQGADGQWSTANGEPEPNTAFGLIFLARGTASLTGTKSSNHASRRYATDAPEANIVLRASGDSPLNMWLSEIRTEAVKDFEREGAAGKGIYVAMAEYLADGEVVASIEGNPSKPWNKETLATQFRFDTRGEHEIQLRLHLAPEGTDADPQVIESPKLVVRIDKLMEDWMLDYPDDFHQNLSLDQRKTFASSTKRNDGNAPGKAFDGLMGTAWISGKSDAEPTLTVRYKRSVRADRIVLSHAASRELSRDHFDRATKVSVALGAKREPQVFELDSNAEHKTVLILERTAKVSELQIRVLEQVAGTKFPGHVGFAEVELRLGD